jgi:tetratricopeptide (TPR) repeat protein
MNQVIKDNYPTPIAERYAAMYRAVSGIRPQYKQALDYLVDLGEIYLQLLAFLSLSELASYEIKLSAKIRTVAQDLKSAALSSGHWLSILKTCAEEFTKCEHTSSLLANHIAALAGPNADTRKLLDRLPALRNDTKHDYSKNEAAAMEVYQARLIEIESILAAGNFLQTIRIFTVVEAIYGQDQNLYELQYFCGKIPEDSTITIETKPQVNFISGCVYATSRVFLENHKLDSQSQFILLDPWILPPVATSPWGLVFFNRCKNKKGAVYQTTSIQGEGRWDDSARLPAIEDFLKKLVERADERPPRFVPPEWTHSLRSVEAMLPDRPPSPENSVAFFQGQSISLGELAGNCDVRRILYRGGAPITYEKFFSECVPEIIDRTVARNECPVTMFSGPGGSGKTTLLWRTCYDLARSNRKVCVLRWLPAYRLDLKSLLDDLDLVMQSGQFEAVGLFIDESRSVAEEIGPAIKEFRFRSLPVCIYMAEQTNQLGLFSCDLNVFELRSLTEWEIEELIGKLDHAGSLGYLGELAPEERVRFFTEFADKQILVALREATSGGKRFDQIIYEEFMRIPDQRGQELYRMVALFHGCDSHLYTESAKHYLGLSKDQVSWRTIRKSCSGIVIHSKVSSNLEALQGRHRVISRALVDRLYSGEAGIDEFSNDACNSITAIHDSALGSTQKFFVNAVRNMVISPCFTEHLDRCQDIEHVVKALCLFESRSWERVNHFFFLGLVKGWKNSGYLNLSIRALEIACHLGSVSPLGNAWSRLGFLLKDRQSMGDTEKAINAFDEALARESDQAQMIDLIYAISSLLQKMIKNDKREKDGICELLQDLINRNPQVLEYSILVIRLSELHVISAHETSQERATEVLEEFLRDHAEAKGLKSVVIRLSELYATSGREGDADRSITVLEKFLQDQPNASGLSSVVIRLSELLATTDCDSDQERCIGVLDEFRRNHSSDLNLSSVVIRLSELLSTSNRSGAPERAIAVLEEFPRDHPDALGLSSVIIRLSELLATSDREVGAERAISVMEEFWSAHPVAKGLKEVVVRLAELHAAGGHKDGLVRAIEILEEFLRNNPEAMGISRIVIRLSEFYAAIGHEGGLERAMEILLQFQQDHPDSPGQPSVVIRLSELLAASGRDGDLDQAIACLKDFLRTHPDTPGLKAVAIRLSELLATSCHEGDKELAISMLEKYQEDHMDAQGVGERIAASVREDDLERGIAVLEEFLRDHPNAPGLKAVAIRLSELLASSSHIDDNVRAVAVLQEFQRDYPDAPGLKSVVIRLSELLAASGHECDVERAIVVLEKFLRDSPFVPGMLAVVIRLSDLLSAKGYKCDREHAIAILWEFLRVNATSSLCDPLVIRLSKFIIPTCAENCWDFAFEVLGRFLGDQLDLVSINSFLAQLSQLLAKPINQLETVRSLEEILALLARIRDSIHRRTVIILLVRLLMLGDQTPKKILANSILAKIGADYPGIVDVDAAVRFLAEPSPDDSITSEAPLTISAVARSEV